MKWSPPAALLLVVGLVLQTATAAVDKNSAEYQQRYSAFGGGGGAASRSRRQPSSTNQNKGGRRRGGYAAASSSSSPSSSQQLARAGAGYELSCEFFDSGCPELHRVQYAAVPPPSWRCSNAQDCAGIPNHCNTRTGQCECAFLSAGPDCKNWRMLHKEWEFIRQQSGLPADSLPDPALMTSMMRQVPLEAIVSTLINQWALVQDPTTSDRDVWVRDKLSKEMKFITAAGLRSIEGTRERFDLAKHLLECMVAVNTGVTWATKNLLRFNQMEQVLHEGIEEYGGEWFYELLPILLQYRNHPNVVAAGFDINARLPDAAGHSLLSLAGHGSFYGAMRILLEHGANPNDQTMVRCAITGDIQCLEIVINAGADPLAEAARDEWGRSPLEVARLNQFVHYTRCYDYLLEVVRDRLPADYASSLPSVFGKYGPPTARLPPGADSTGDGNNNSNNNNASSGSVVAMMTCAENGLCKAESGDYATVHIPRADMDLRKRCPIQVGGRSSGR